VEKKKVHNSPVEAEGKQRESTADEMSIAKITLSP